jgi:YesN/AraC family two-component response regulator
VPPIKLLWIDTGGSRDPQQSCPAEFTRSCEVQQIAMDRLAAEQLRGKWDLVCFDFDFPETATLRLILEAKKRWPSAPILMLTLQNSPELALWALRARVFDLLVKPVRAQEVARCMERVRVALEARRMQSQRIPQGAINQVPIECRYRSQPPARARLQLAVAYVVKNYLREIPESEVARICDMSPSRFCREFKSAFGVTFVEYLSHYRVAKAKRLLANPKISVTDVAAATGFGDPSYFTRVFRKHASASPSEYRAALATLEGTVPGPGRADSPADCEEVSRTVPEPIR